MPYWLPQTQKKHSITTLPHHRPMVLVPAGVGNGVGQKHFFYLAYKVTFSGIFFNFFKLFLFELSFFDS